MTIQILIGMIIGLIWYYRRKERKERMKAERERELFERGFMAAQEYRGEKY